jgi:hypothetical protein
LNLKMSTFDTAHPSPNIIAKVYIILLTLRTPHLWAYLAP